MPQRKDPARGTAREPLALPPRLDLTDAPPAPAPSAPAVAVALRQDNDAAPTVVASGRGRLAEQIVALAFAAGIAVREDSDLAELLAAVEIDLPIPPSCFEAVAEIMSYLYRANAGAPAGAAR